MINGLLSFVVHLSIISLLFLNISQQSNNKASGNVQDNIEIVEKDKESESNKGTDGILKQQEVVETKECSSYYGGIGILLSYRDGYYFAEKVYKGYPADNAGIMPGDLLEFNEDVKGEVGTLVIIQVTNQTDTKRIIIRREKICTNDTSKDN